MSNSPRISEVFEASDVNGNKGMAAVAYILFFIPMLAAQRSRFAMYHANQGLTLLLVSVLANIVLGIIPVLGWILLPFVNLGILVLAIIGIIAAAQGTVRPLPLIGGFTLLK